MATIQLPAPAGSALAGQIQMQAMRGLGQALGGWNQSRLQGRDIQSLQSMDQRQNIFNDMYGARGMQAPQAQVPQMQSRLGRQAMLGGQLQNMFRDPLEREHKQAQIDATKALTDARRNAKSSTYEVSWFDKTGKKKQTRVTAENYDALQSWIEREGGTLNEPESWDDKYDLWQARYNRAAPEVDPLGHIVPGTGDTKAAERALQELRKLEKARPFSSKQNQVQRKGVQKSPYPEYPNAFKEGGVWKVMRNGKDKDGVPGRYKYRIEED